LAPTFGGILNVSILYIVSYAILLHASPLVVAEITLFPIQGLPPKIGLVYLYNNLLEPLAGFMVEPDEDAIISNKATF